MAITIEATYEDGVLKPKQPLPLKEHQRLRITLHLESSPILKAYGIMGWSGDAQVLEQLALDPEYVPQEDE